MGRAGLRGRRDYGRPLNPHNPEHVTGGSSSGSGAAVAGGLGGHRLRAAIRAAPSGCPPRGAASSG